MLSPAVHDGRRKWGRASRQSDTLHAARTRARSCDRACASESLMAQTARRRAQREEYRPAMGGRRTAEREIHKSAVRNIAVNKITVVHNSRSPQIAVFHNFIVHKYRCPQVPLSTSAVVHNYRGSQIAVIHKSPSSTNQRRARNTVVHESPSFTTRGTSAPRLATRARQLGELRTNKTQLGDIVIVELHNGCPHPQCRRFHWRGISAGYRGCGHEPRLGGLMGGVRRAGRRGRRPRLTVMGSAAFDACIQGLHVALCTAARTGEADLRAGNAPGCSAPGQGGGRERERGHASQALPGWPPDQVTRDRWTCPYACRDLSP